MVRAGSVSIGRGRLPRPRPALHFVALAGAGRGPTTDTAVASLMMLQGRHVSDEDQGGEAPPRPRPATGPMTVPSGPWTLLLVDALRRRSEERDVVGHGRVLLRLRHLAA